MSKRSLLVLSHAMERAFDARPRSPESAVTAAPGLVLALFERREYFDVEAERYAALARRGCTVVVAFTDAVAGLPEGVHGVALEPGTPLSLEWSLVLLCGGYGSALTAHDARRLVDGELTLQASRVFRAHWTFRRRVAAEQARRILNALAHELPEAVVAAARTDIATADLLPVSDVEAQLAAATDDLVTSLEAGNRRAVRLRVELDGMRTIAERDQLTGLPNRYYLERFLGGGADAPADLAVLLVDIDNLKSVNDRFGHLAGDAVITAVAGTIHGEMRSGDVVIRWGGDEFLVLAAGLAADEAMVLAQRIIAAVRSARAVEPWAELLLSVSIGVGTTLRTILPFDALDSALYSVKRSGKGRAALAPVTVATR